MMSPTQMFRGFERVDRAVDRLADRVDDPFHDDERAVGADGVGEDLPLSEKQKQLEHNLRFST